MHFSMWIGARETFQLPVLASSHENLDRQLDTNSCVISSAGFVEPFVLFPGESGGC